MLFELIKNSKEREREKERKNGKREKERKKGKREKERKNRKREKERKKKTSFEPFYKIIQDQFCTGFIKTLWDSFFIRTQ